MSSPSEVAEGPASSLDETLFASELVQAGRFRCSSTEPEFETAASPTQTHCFVFPRVAVWIEHEDHAPFVADPNTIPVYNAGRPYRRRSIGGGGDRADWFGIAPGVLREIVARHDPRAADAELPFRFGWAQAGGGTYLAQRNIYRHLAGRRTPDPLFVEEAVVNLATDIVDEAYRRGPAREARTALATCERLVERTREHLATSFATRVSLAALTRDVGASVFHLCRTFKRQTGFSIHQYRNQLRIRHSLELLEHEPGDILAVALRVGFAGHSHYTRTFRALAGVTPSAFVAPRDGCPAQERANGMRAGDSRVRIASRRPLREGA